MVILITGASHTGKTAFAQKLLETHQFPYLSIDHLKMGLIRSGQTRLTPMDDDLLTPYLWPILREIIKTVIENRQNLIIEGCYIPFDWQKDFSASCLQQIRYLCLAFSEDYIRDHFDQIAGNADCIEKRLDDSGLNQQELIQDNAMYLEGCRRHGLPCHLIDDHYSLPELSM